MNSKAETEALRLFAAQAEQAPTIKADKEDIIFDPALSAGEPLSESEAKYQNEFASALQTDELKEALTQAVKTSAAYQKEANSEGTRREASKARAEQRADQTEGKSHAPSSNAPNFRPSAGTQMVEKIIDAEEKKGRGGPALIGLFLQVFVTYNEMAERENYRSVYLYSIRLAAEHAESGSYISYTDIREIEEQMEIITKQAVGPGGGGLAQVTALRSIVDKFLERYADAWDLKQVRQGKNPFGAMGGLYISRKDFLDKDGRFNDAKARDFRKNAGKYVPYLLMWDQILRLIAQLADIQQPFYPGFVLNDKAVAIFQGLPSCTRMLSINPYWFKLAKKGYANAQDLALFLHAVACHELAHMERGIGHGDGHDEEFSAIREALADKSFPAIPAITALVAQILGVPDLTPKGKRSAADRERIAELEAQVAGGCPACLKQLVTALERDNRLDTVKWQQKKVEE